MKKTVIILITLSGFILFNSSCSKDKEEIVEVVTIGEQVWMSKNLNVEKFRNGDSIPQVKSDKEWDLASKNKKPAWCYYNNLPSNGEIYGKLYNRYAVTDSRGLAPNGFHIPNNLDFYKLISFLDDSLGTAIKIKSTTGWYNNSNGTNSSGFSALPSGNRNPSGSFSGIEMNASWWSTDTDRTPGYSNTIGLLYSMSWMGSSGQNNGCGFPIRCVKD